MNIRIIEDEWAVSSIDDPPTVFFSMPSDILEIYGCVIHRIEADPNYWEVVPLIDYVILALSWEALVIIISNKIGTKEAYCLDNWQLNDLEIYRFFNAEGLYVFSTEELSEMVPHLKAQAKSLNKGEFIE